MVDESEGDEEREGRWAEEGIESSSSSSSSSLPSSFNSSSSSASKVSLALKEGRPRLPVGADFRRGAAAVLLDFDAGLGGLKEGALRLGAAFEIVGGMLGRKDRFGVCGTIRSEQYRITC